ncbi:lipoprotein [Mesorhizobium sp. M0938]|uniref:Type IV secretion system putative lipoprotein virB7 n=1 Tax=Mesorhizobium robiniae TaxID=559315 RepID=A0ABV2GSH9_9HYPH
MRKMIIAMVAVVAVSGCSTTEQDVGVGAGVGALAGGLINGGKGALVGAAIGAGSGLLVRNLRNGYCQYRDNRGRLYTARC